MQTSHVQTFHCASHGLTDTGNVRSHNEDALLDAGAAGLWAVADGAGGHDRGEVASQMIVQELAQLKPQVFLGEQAQAVSACLQAVNARLISMRALPGSQGIIGSTVCVLLVHGKHSVCLWAGDSRIYLLRGGKLQQLTRDHNRMEEFLAAGFSEADLHKYPAARQLVRAVGVTSPLPLEMQMQECCAGDCFLLCSDGLSGELEEAEITAILQAGPSVQATVEQLVQAVLARRARDNVTALAVRLENPTDANMTP
ncbi:PP2C family serine/threonine-protein phosphatase [Candidatus Thiothrix sp. Deng01]|uniref:PP2C family serine/threonine-protein phosphatase n=1 Tax=Candidatus Thiothrix phosphatis TaxID=3112415 RepID=A0ABU6CWR9_9GAMM|nr:PP2C family serine/threonine-protein phosphatase [Candidatus Thiothrix sp. Deng01]MEB4591285.1 PP2C family serine/threonine-protein phosphatase [Candidatus Thiothrix sp. Deng01]